MLFYNKHLKRLFFIKKILKKILSTSRSLFLYAGLVPLSYLKADAASLVGIKNIGNTCYYNAEIQQLYSCKSLRARVIRYSGDRFNAYRSGQVGVSEKIGY